MELIKTEGELDIRSTRGRNPVEANRPEVTSRKTKSALTNGTRLLQGVDGRSPWVCRCKDIIAAHISDLGGVDNISAAERSIVRRAAALPMTDEQLQTYQQHTGRSSPPTAPSHEAWLVIGRRGGKSFVLAAIAIFLACFKDWRPFLGPGELGTVMIIAADRRQARVIMRYCLGLLETVPMLKQQIKGTTRESISLKNRIVIEIHTASVTRRAIAIDDKRRPGASPGDLTRLHCC
jgi:hypothetical protein